MYLYYSSITDLDIVKSVPSVRSTALNQSITSVTFPCNVVPTTNKSSSTIPTTNKSDPCTIPTTTVTRKGILLLMYLYYSSITDLDIVKSVPSVRSTALNQSITSVTFPCNVVPTTNKSSSTIPTTNKSDPCTIPTSDLLPSPDTWVKIDGIVLNTDHKYIIENGQWLNDTIIDAAQRLLRKQSSNIAGWQTPQLGVGYKFATCGTPFIQILHVLRNHWIVATNINCTSTTVNIYDSAYSAISHDTKLQIVSMIRPSTNELTYRNVNFQRQTNNSDCGVFAIAVATELVLGRDPVLCYWKIQDMRQHLIRCLENKELSSFPGKTRRIPPGSKTKLIVTEKVYCICRMINDPSLPMIKCDKCHNWYHLNCLNVDECDCAKKWFCINCI